MNFGRNYAGARDEYVYVYSQDNDSAYEPADRMVLARVPADRIRDREAYSIFTGMKSEYLSGRLIFPSAERYLPIPAAAIGQELLTTQG